jgi:hypothetical protein
MQNSSKNTRAINNSENGMSLFFFISYLSQSILYGLNLKLSNPTYYKAKIGLYQAFSRFLCYPEAVIPVAYIWYGSNLFYIIDDNI